MKHQLTTRLAVLILAMLFSLITVLALAATKQWFVIKNKKGVCKVIQAIEQTPETLGGPFKTKEEAEKWKARECRKRAETTTEPLRRQHRQTEQPKYERERVDQGRSHQESVEQKSKQQTEGTRKPQTETEKTKMKAQEKDQESKSAKDKPREKTTEPGSLEKKDSTKQ